MTAPPHANESFLNRFDFLDVQVFLRKMNDGDQEFKSLRECKTTKNFLSLSQIINLAIRRNLAEPS